MYFEEVCWKIKMVSKGFDFIQETKVINFI